jgi:hypothetical protein
MAKQLVHQNLQVSSLVPKAKGSESSFFGFMNRHVMASATRASPSIFPDMTIEDDVVVVKLGALKYYTFIPD